MNKAAFRTKGHIFAHLPHVDGIISKYHFLVTFTIVQNHPLFRLLHVCLF